MEPLDDRELNHLLQQWKAPATPAGIEKRVFLRGEPWWKWLVSGAIRVPVPVVFAVAALLVVLFYSRTSDKPRPKPGTVSLADFQAVRELEPRVIGRGYEAHH